jgi:DNA-binding NarL/FixJ family response regulator/tetratricopeptide (TPR) repeat protein
MVDLAEHLVGRVAELDALDGALAEVEQRHPVALALAGEPGIGKSRLLAELGSRADARGHIVLSGRASELELDLPFGVLADALDDYVTAMEPRRLERLDPAIRRELAHVLPALRDPDAAPAAASPDERYRAHRAMRELLELVAASKPLVLLLDDVHWSDAGTVELLGALLRRPPAAGVLMVVALRPRQLPERLSAVLLRAEREGGLTRLELGALSRSESDELLGAGVDPAEAPGIFAQSGGNPFYLEQLARMPGRAAAGSRSQGDVVLAGVEVPSAVAAALAEELTLLEPLARRVLEGAAVAGDPFEPELAAAVADLAEPEALQGLDELLRLDLVRATDVPRRFRFRHPLVRGAVYRGTAAGWRLAAHERAASELAARGASAAARAHHVERSAREGDREAVAVLREAGEAASRRAPASAAQWFAGALRVLAHDAPAEERVELLMARAGALAATGQFVEAHAALLESLELLPGDAPALRVRLVGACAAIEHLLGRHDAAHGRLVRALGELAADDSPEAVALTIELSVDGFYRREYGEMRRWAADAVEAARSLGDPPLLAAAVAQLALAGAFDNAIAEAEAARVEAAALVDAMGDEELAVRLDAAANLGGAETYLDRFDEAGAHAERAIAVGRAAGRTDLFPVLFPVLGTVKLVRGRPDEGGRLLDTAVEAARLAGSDQGLAWQLFNRSAHATAAGDLATALATAQESVDLVRELEQSMISAWAGAFLAEALLQSGDPKRATDVLESHAGGDELIGIPGGWRAYALELLTRCRVAVGNLDGARHAADAAMAVATTVGLRYPMSMAQRAAAAVALASGAPDEAAEHALVAAQAAQDVGAPIEEGLARTLAGRAMAAAGDREAAVAQLRLAADALAACGSVRHRDAAERELRKLGQRHQRRTARGQGNGLASLSERELEVARLVVDRHTNNQIAAELFLSTKTVETHLRNIFIKLGVSSRVELARVVERGADDVTRERATAPPAGRA